MGVRLPRLELCKLFRYRYFLPLLPQKYIIRGLTFGAVKVDNCVFCKRRETQWV